MLQPNFTMFALTCFRSYHPTLVLDRNFISLVHIIFAKNVLTLEFGWSEVNLPIKALADRPIVLAIIGYIGFYMN